MNHVDRGLIAAEVSAIKLYGIPIGKYAIALGALGRDETTQSSAAIVRQQLPESGFLVADAHQSVIAIDMMVTAARIAVEFPDLQGLVAPVASKWSEKAKNPILRIVGKEFNRSINNQPHLSTYIVVRREDRQYLSDENFSQKDETNSRFQQHIKKDLGEGVIAVLAAYGSGKEYLIPDSIRYGLVGLALIYPLLCSRTVRRRNRLGHTVYLSGIHEPKGKGSEQEVRSWIQSQFLELDEKKS